jgi:glycosyltransferase involved in cell wall biosynthesis
MHSSLISSDHLQSPAPLTRVNVFLLKTPGCGSSVDFQVTIVVISRLAYRKGIDLLVAAAPRICSAFPNVKFLIGRDPIPPPFLLDTKLFEFKIQKGGTGPKLNELLQMREKHLLQDRIELLGPVRHSDVRDVSCLHCTCGPRLMGLGSCPCLLGIIGPCSRFYILEYLFDRVFWHRDS